jgi:hypothetical protein
MTTPYEVPGFTRPAELYELASNHGIHAGSMDKLMRFALEIQRRAHTTEKEEKEIANEVAR